MEYQGFKESFMRASELKNLLGKIITDHGDIDIMLPDEERGGHRNVAIVEVTKEEIDIEHVSDKDVISISTSAYSNGNNIYFKKN